MRDRVRFQWHLITSCLGLPCSNRINRFFSLFPPRKPLFIIAIYSNVNRKWTKKKNRYYLRLLVISALLLWKYREMVWKSRNCTFANAFSVRAIFPSHSERLDLRFEVRWSLFVFACSNSRRSSLSLKTKAFQPLLFPLKSQSIALWTKTIDSKKHNILKLNTGLGMRLKIFSCVKSEIPVSKTYRKLETDRKTDVHDIMIWVLKLINWPVIMFTFDSDPNELPPAGNK